MVSFDGSLPAYSTAGLSVGSLLFGVLVSKLLLPRRCARLHGSGNAGMTNVLRTYGKLPAVITYHRRCGQKCGCRQAGAALSLIRCCPAPGLISSRFCSRSAALTLAAIFCMLGHSKPVFFGLRGGKGVLVGAGAALATEPIACLVLLVIFLVEVAITHIVSLGSIIIAALYPVLTLCYWLWKGTDAASLVFITVCCVLMGAYVIWLHRSNIQRLKNGTEYRFGEKKERKPVILLHFLFFSIACSLAKTHKIDVFKPKALLQALGFVL